MEEDDICNWSSEKDMYKKLFEPISIGTLKLKNRLIVPGMDSGTISEHKFTDRSITYLTERVKGGFGLIITEFLCVDKTGLASVEQAAIYSDEYIESLRLLTDAVHEAGGKIAAQLHHAGAMAKEEATGMLPWSPSGMPLPGKMIRTREMSIQDIEYIVKCFVEAAVRAEKAGFDAVELQAGHGYLLGQFLSRGNNKRNDCYGGTCSNRFRIVRCIIRGIKEAVGADYPVIVRISADEYMEGGNTIEDTLAYIPMIENVGADAIHVTSGNLTSGTSSGVIRPYQVKNAYNMENSRKIRNMTNLPVICVGRITDENQALAVVESEAADMVSIGRESLADPYFPEKIKAGRTEEILHCTGCLQRCCGNVCDEEDSGISCAINPFTGKEKIWKIEEAEKKKEIIVVGAGPAGLQAAWILAKRGHDVTVYEKEEKVGGAYNLAAIPPNKQDHAATIYTYKILCRKYGVKIVCQHSVKYEELKELQTDEIIVATGAVPFVFPIKGKDNPNVLVSWDVLKGDKLVQNQKVLVIGAGLVGCETALYLSQYNNQITMCDAITEMGTGQPKSVKQYLFKELHDHNIQCVLGGKVCEIFSDGVVFEKDGKREAWHGYQTIIFATGSRPEWKFEEESEHIHVIGDAKKARNVKTAVYEATKLALRL